MKKIISQFFANIRHARLKRRIEREIYHKIFPHLNKHANHGYPFSSDDEMVKLHLKGFFEASLTIDDINRAAAKMPRAEGDAFRYIVARDLTERMRMYLEFANEREYSNECDPQFVATAA